MESIGQLSQIGVLLGSIVLVAFFSSSEASLIAVNKIRIRYLAEQGSKPAQAVSRVVSNHEKFFATVLFTENAFIILASSMGTVMAISLFGESSLTVLLTTLALTVLIVAFGEITPKSLAAQAAERWSLIVARPIEILMTMETFLIYFFTLLPKGILMLMGGKEIVQTPLVTEGELRMLIGIGRDEGMVEKEEAQMLENVFQFGDLQCREVMTPTSEVIWVPLGTTLRDFLAIYLKHPHTRFPVSGDDCETVFGILSVKDVIAAIASDEISELDSVTSFVQQTYSVPETKLIGVLFREMQKEGSQMAMTINELGGISGLVTLKQLTEEIVGPWGEEDGMQSDVQ